MKRLLLLLPGGVLLSAPANATIYQVCVDYDIALGDADAGVGDDYVTNDTSHINADGIRIRVIHIPTSTVVEDSYASTGTYPGCLDVDIDYPGQEHKVIALSEAQVSGNTIKVWDDDNTNNLYSHVKASWYPLYTGDLTMVTPVDDQWNMMAMFKVAMERSDAGLSGETLVGYTETCPNPNYNNCIGLGTPNGHSGRLYLSSTGADRKYTIVHEMGHWVAWRVNNNTHGVASSAYSDTGNPCSTASGHYFHTEEYQGLAAAEGIANYYAAYAFNSAASNECFYRSGSVINWDYSGSGDDDDWSCDVAPLSGLGLNDTDYHDQICSGGADRGVEYDWLRFWWNVTTGYDVTPEDVFAVWDAANPQNWESTIDTGTEDTGADVASALHHAATVVVGGDVGDGYGDLYLDHGLDR